MNQDIKDAIGEMALGVIGLFGLVFISVGWLLSRVEEKWIEMKSG